MRQKVFYRFNPVTDQYERVYPSRRERAMLVARNFAFGATGALAVVILAYNLIDFPREKELKLENERMQSRLEILERRADEAISVMEDVVERDNNFYRVMMQSEPVSPAQRYAGLERQRNLDKLDNYTESELITAIDHKLDQLDRLVYSEIKSFDYLQGEASKESRRLRHIPAIQPISEKFLRAMASGYGSRLDPIYGTMKFHEGMDFSSPTGTPVYATGDGTVTTASWEGAYGNMVEINHGFNYTTRYAHLSEICVAPGRSVKRGDLIGKVGNTGKSTGSHLHYEVRLKGVPQNPVNYYFYDLTPEQYDEMIILAENAGHVMD